VSGVPMDKIHSDPAHSFMPASVCQFSLTPCTAAGTPDSHRLRGADWPWQNGTRTGTPGQKVESGQSRFCRWL
ncbi:mCG146000, partial [Mus musculus]